MVRFLPEGLVAHVLLEMRRQVRDLIADGELTAENVDGVFEGGFKQLDIRPAQALGVDPAKEMARILKA